MRVTVAYDTDEVELEVADDALVGHWPGARNRRSEPDIDRLIEEAVERPVEYPPLRQAVVPGDHVVIALDPAIPEPGRTLEATLHVLERAGVERDSVTALVPGGTKGLAPDDLPSGIRQIVHDPADRKHLAYLATTQQGRRVYLNRELTDADFVLPIGRMTYDPVLGYGGPWGIVYPGLSDEETMGAFRGTGIDALPSRNHPNAPLTESAEVSWLLGCQFQLAIVPSVDGVGEVIAGLTTAVRDHGAAVLDDTWSFEAEARAELVVVGVGGGPRASIDDLARALASASRLVQRGGKIVALSRAVGTLGPSLQRLCKAGDPKQAVAALRGHENDADWIAARLIAGATAWADVYALSALGTDVVEDLGMVALERPAEARRLVASSGSCVVVSHAEMTRCQVAGEDR
jgi:nickel-dependent lactate racemase